MENAVRAARSTHGSGAAMRARPFAVSRRVPMPAAFRGVHLFPPLSGAFFAEAPTLVRSNARGLGTSQLQ